ncbi:MAG: ankyrin repeat domain-containing protein [Bacteriovorax sp.]|nr:ankyrin repeat domain-containing protein [Bacteriovorax sp.]
MSNFIRAKVILGALFILFSNLASANEEQWYDAARSGNLDALTGVEAHDLKKLNAQNEKGYTAYILASYNGQNAYAEKLLKLGADVCLTDLKGNNALMGVIFKGYEAMALALIDKCDVNHRNNEAQTPLMYASLFGREKIAEALIKAGARVDLKDRQGRNAISLAEGQWNKAMVTFLKTFKIIQ